MLLDDSIRLTPKKVVKRGCESIEGKRELIFAFSFGSPNPETYEQPYRLH